MILTKRTLLQPLFEGWTIRLVVFTNLMVGKANGATILFEDEPLATAWGGSDYTKVTAHILHLHSEFNHNDLIRA